MLSSDSEIPLYQGSRYHDSEFQTPWLISAGTKVSKFLRARGPQPYNPGFFHFATGPWDLQFCPVASKWPHVNKRWCFIHSYILATGDTTILICSVKLSPKCNNTMIPGDKTKSTTWLQTPHFKIPDTMTHESRYQNIEIPSRLKPSPLQPWSLLVSPGPLKTNLFWSIASKCSCIKSPQYFLSLHFTLLATPQYSDIW